MTATEAVSNLATADAHRELIEVENLLSGASQNRAVPQQPSALASFSDAAADLDVDVNLPRWRFSGTEWEAEEDCAEFDILTV